MSNLELPDSIASLVDHLQVVQISWEGIPVQLPRFAVYAVLDNPVFDRYFYRHGRKMAMLKLGRYQIPVLDPFRGNLDHAPEHVVVISHAKSNRFGLYGYPADHVATDIRLPIHHRSVKRITQDFV